MVAHPDCYCCQLLQTTVILDSLLSMGFSDIVPFMLSQDPCGALAEAVEAIAGNGASG